MACALTLAPLAGGLAACSSEPGDPLAGAPYDAADQVAVNALDSGNSGGTVDSSKPLEVTVKDGEGKITDVTAVDAVGRFVSGKLSDDGRRWHSTSPLAAGVRYTVRISTENDDGQQGRRTVNFQTKPPNARKLSVTFGPGNGTYGVAQPITAELSHRVKGAEQRKRVEGALQVTSSPRVQGSWHWVDSKELHFRPRSYWPAHASISVRAQLAGVKVRNGLYGGTGKPLRMTTGDRIEALADAGSDHMKFKRNGKTIRDIPITTGKSGFETRYGTKVIMGKEAFVRMRSSTVGIGGGDSYDLPVHWATRLTPSGEYVHAAPWSVGSQGSSNSSHGCTGMSTENAKWFFDHVRPGVPVTHVHTGGDKMPTFKNGYGDWNMSWRKWREGSALNGGGGDKSGATNRSTGDTARLRPEL